MKRTKSDATIDEFYNPDTILIVIKKFTEDQCEGFSLAKFAMYDYNYIRQLPGHRI
jgi:hypothetical protein